MVRICIRDLALHNLTAEAVSYDEYLNLNLDLDLNLLTCHPEPRRCHAEPCLLSL